MNQRMQTGKMEFQNDWPGVFIRGDEALSYAAAIRRLLAAGAPCDLSDEWLRDSRHCLSELAALLESCRTRAVPFKNKTGKKV
jgi:hypothetical protein